MRKRIKDILFILSALFVLISSIYMKDTPSAIIASFFGIIYTILIGKGKIIGYIFGAIGTLSGAYLSFKMALWGYFALHIFYYFPMEIFGFLSWSKHLNKKTKEVIKTKLNKKETIILTLTTILISSVLYLTFKFLNNISPFWDSIITTLSILAMYLTVKRCYEQWVVWTLVNIFSVFMWFNFFVAGEKIFSVLAVRIIYLILGIHFYFIWEKENKKH